MRQARPWRYPAPSECARCDAAAQWLVYLPEVMSDGTLRDREAAFAGTLLIEPALSCDEHCAQMMDDVIPASSMAGGVAAAPLRATWRGWFLDNTTLGRLLWRLHLRRCARFIATAG